MARPIVIPTMGMYMAEGTVLAWLRSTGAYVAAGEPIVEITTEKVTFEVVAPAAGVLHPIAPVGTSLPVEALLGYILDLGEDPPAPSADRITHAPSGDALYVGRTSSGTRESARDVPGSSSVTRSQGPIRATPAARRLAAEYGVELARVSGTGPGGRIVEKDVLAAASRASEAAAKGGAPELRRVRHRVPLAGMRRAIGQRLRESLSTAVSLTLTREVAADTFVAAREELAKLLGTNVPYDALFIKVFAAALRQHSELNAVIEDEAILMFDEVHIGLAVAVPGGLLVPVVRDADVRPLSSVVAVVRELSERARVGRLRPEDLDGGTATISNLGAHGVDAFTPVLNPPQSVILGIGRLVPSAIVRGGQVVAGQTCILSLTFDHRVADGVPAADLLARVADLMADQGYLGSLAL